ncbi:MAG TPA: ATP-binding protein [Gammaproteobacteria bacterium]|nr:ATP-binding protein [Gammaproteobacteria bacterium]
MDGARRTPILSFLLTGSAILAAWALRAALTPVVGSELPLILFLPPVIVGTMLGGLRLGLVTTVVSCIVGLLLFIPRADGPFAVAVEDWVRITLFLLAGALVSWLVSSWRRGWEAVRSSEERLRSEHRRRAEILESIGDAFYAVDADFRFTYVNSKAEQWWHRPRAELLGKRLWTEFPEAAGTVAEEMHRKVMRDRAPVRFEAPSPVVGRWVDVSLYPEAGGGLSCYFRDLTDRKTAEDALREADRRKDEFLAVLGHELRNPLAPLRAGLELMRSAADRPELAKHVQVMMERQLGHLVHLVDDLLDLSRITRGDIDLVRAPLDLRAVIDAAVELAAPIVAERGHRLILEHREAALPVYGDFQRLTQVVANLLSNAAKYMEPGGTIEVRAEACEADVSVSVKDNGFGIPPDRLEDIFTMFSQVPEHRARIGGGGLGIGLALARQLVALHGGTLTAASEGLGHGSEFVLRLPRSRTVGAASRSAAPPRAAAAARGAPSRRVLVVDDNVDAAESLKMVLELKGHDVHTVYDGAAALAAVERLRPECVLLDIGLPQLDGYEVARRIRAMPNGGRIRLFALTGWGQDEDKHRAREAGFDEHLTKPVDSSLLEEVMELGNVPSELV